MNSKKLTVAVLLGIVVIAFLVGMNTFQRRVQNTQAEKVTQQADRLVRFHSPIFGPANAPVTIVEFFDPACETCRAFYPMVKNLMKQYHNRQKCRGHGDKLPEPSSHAGLRGKATGDKPGTGRGQSGDKGDIY